MGVLSIDATSERLQPMLRQLRHLRSQLGGAAAYGGSRATRSAYIVRAAILCLHEPAVLCAASEHSCVAAATPSTDSLSLAAALCLAANLAAASTTADNSAASAGVATPFVRAVVLLHQLSAGSLT